MEPQKYISCNRVDVLQYDGTREMRLLLAHQKYVGVFNYEGLYADENRHLITYVYHTEKPIQKGDYLTWQVNDDGSYDYVKVYKELPENYAKI